MSMVFIVNITFMRILRLAKIARTLRMFRSFFILGELWLVIECMLGSFVNLF